MRGRLLIGSMFVLFAGSARAQCTNYTITITAGTWPAEIDWELVDDVGTVVASGLAPAFQTVCLPDGCYTMYMYDSYGDGWNGATFTIKVQPANTTVASGTLANGTFGSQQVSLGTGCGGGPCDWYTMTVTAGIFPTEISWNLVSGVSVVQTGFAPTTISLCIDTGCYVMQMFDSFGDGWNGATWTLSDALGNTVQSGTLASGSIGQTVIPLGVPASGCGSVGPITASDCPDAVNICTNYSWAIDPNGIGALNEIPPLGSLGNPDLIWGDAVPSAWGSDNYGCLRNNELNSTWMIINISGGGSLEFTFGGLGTQAGFYDWIMYPYNATTCAGVMANTVPPIRCNWNFSSSGGTGLAATTPPGGDPGNYEPPLNVLAGEQYLICFSNWSSVTTVVPLEFGGTATVSCEPVVLPVELTAFAAQARLSDVLLGWTTASECNSSHFEVQRSTDLWTWDVIGSVDAAGNCTGTRHYGHVDPSPVPGESFYRLLVVDNDGSAETSAIVSVRWMPPGALVHPNPSTGSFWVESAEQVSVIDATGRAMMVVREAVTEKAQCLRIGAPGLYSVRVGYDEAVPAVRILVQ